MNVNNDTREFSVKFSKFLTECIPEKKPKDMDDDKLVAITCASMTAAHAATTAISDLGFMAMVERNLTPYKVKMSIEEYMYVSNIMDKLVSSVPEVKKIMSHQNQAHYS